MLKNILTIAAGILVGGLFLTIVIFDVVNQASLSKKFEDIQISVSTNTKDIQTIVDFINKANTPAEK